MNARKVADARNRRLGLLVPLVWLVSAFLPFLISSLLVFLFFPPLLLVLRLLLQLVRFVYLHCVVAL